MNKRLFDAVFAVAGLLLIYGFQSVRYGKVVTVTLLEESYGLGLIFMSCGVLGFVIRVMFPVTYLRGIRIILEVFGLYGIILLSNTVFKGNFIMQIIPAICSIIAYVKIVNHIESKKDIVRVE